MLKLQTCTTKPSSTGALTTTMGVCIKLKVLFSTIPSQFSPFITILSFVENLTLLEKANKYVVFCICMEEVTGAGHRYKAK